MATPARARRCSHRHDGLSADVHHRARRPTSSRRCGAIPPSCGGRASSARTSRAVHLAAPPRRAPAGVRRAPDPALLGRLLDAGRREPDDARARAAGRVRADRPAAGARRLVSAGHTDASAAEAHLAFDRGATHRHASLQRDAPAGPARSRGSRWPRWLAPDVTVQLIADGHHVAGDTLLVAWRAARGRIALVTDAVAATAMGDGDSRSPGARSCPPRRRARAGGPARRQRARR